MRELVSGVVVGDVGVGTVPGGLRDVTIVGTTAVTKSSEPWAVGRRGAHDGAGGGVLCHGCAWWVKG